MFWTDLDNDALPQWMYISPNIINDGMCLVHSGLTVGHDTGITFAANWTLSFLTNVLRNSKFNNNTCVLVTFDENEIYPRENRVYSLLLGDSIPRNLRGSKDSTFYTHYSQLSTVQVCHSMTLLT
jgi:acid phosphatase